MKYIIYNFAQRSQEWVNIRKGKITASIAGKIIYLRHLWDILYKTIVQEYQEERTQDDIDRINIGINDEPEGREWYCKIFKVEVEEVGFFQSLEYPYLGASPDGLVSDDGIIEIKCPVEPYLWAIHPEHDISIYQYAQIQMTLAITNRKWCDYIMYCKKANLVHCRRIYFDVKYWTENLLPILKEFANYYKLNC